MEVWEEARKESTALELVSPRPFRRMRTGRMRHKTTVRHARKLLRCSKGREYRATPAVRQCWVIHVDCPAYSYDPVKTKSGRTTQKASSPRIATLFTHKYQASAQR